MFKVITELVLTPHFFLLCDNRNCCGARGGPLDRTSMETVAYSQQEFLRLSVADGWVIGLEAQLCPPHAAELRARAAELEARSKLVQVVPGNGHTQRDIDRLAEDAVTLRGKPPVKPH